jgi:hypothetical protein
MDTVLLELFSTSSLKRTKLAPRMGCEIGTIKVAVSLTCCARTSGADSRDNANKQSKRAFMVSPPQGLASNDPRHTIYARTMQSVVPQIVSRAEAERCWYVRAPAAPLRV